jgi:hypothetical protein
MHYKARYKVLLYMTISKASSAAKSKDSIDMSLDEDNAQLAEKKSLGLRKRKAVPASSAASVPIVSASGSSRDRFTSGGIVIASLQPTLFECMPTHSYVLGGDFEEYQEE